MVDGPKTFKLLLDISFDISFQNIAFPSLMVDPININVDVFCETSVGFLKKVVLQFFPKYSQSYVNLNIKSRPDFNCL